MIEQGKQKPIIETSYTGDRRNFTHVTDLVKAYYQAIEKCVPGELYVIGSENPGNVHTFREVLNMLIEISELDKNKIKIVTDPKFVRPTNVPRLIGDISKFKKLTGWESKIPFIRILEDTLKYWRQFVKEDLY